MKAYERLINYTKYETGSVSDNDKCPSSPEQLVFGKALAQEMKDLGIVDINIDENGYVFGTIEANVDNWKGTVIGFLAHLDVVRDVPYQEIKTKVISNYDGSDIVLNPEKNIVLSPEDFTSLKNYVGKDLLVTDGTTLLGADDKAGIAEILTMAETLKQHPEIKHGTIKLGFTPDEEIGRGADLFDVKRFGADYAYTVDGAAFGEIEYERFVEYINRIHLNKCLPKNHIRYEMADLQLMNFRIVAMDFKVNGSLSNLWNLEAPFQYIKQLLIHEMMRAL
jgi:tripeptide aminopeptidase